MKDEIKEILEYVLSLTYGNENAIKGINKVEDYITNLQEENDILKRDIEAMKHNYNLLVRLIENGESMTQKFENGLTYQDYKSRNEKAIEMFDDEILNKYYYGMSYEFAIDDFKEDIFKILKGE